MSSSSSATNATALLQPIEVAPKRAPATKQDSCTWDDNGKCNSPVTCEACINTALSDQTCGIGAGGTCVAMQLYPNGYRLDSSIVYFPSTNFTYCGASDATCTACKSSWTQVYKDTGVYPANKLCQGEDGCICVSQCESPSFAAKVITGQCSLFGDTIGPAKKIYSAVSAIGVVVIGVAIFRAWRREKRDQAQAAERRERQQQRRLERSAERGLKGPPQLCLSGWKSLQEKLLASERGFLDGDKKSLTEIGLAATATVHDSGVRSDIGSFASDVDGDDGEYCELEEGLEGRDEERSRPDSSA